MKSTKHQAPSTKHQAPSTLKLFSFIMFCLFITFNCYSQKLNSSQALYTPQGIFDNVLDNEGKSFNLSEIIAGKSTIDLNGVPTTNTLLCTPGIFELYFETGSGMEIVGNTLHDQRRAIICQAFQDYSDFINTPLKNAGNTAKVKIWVRKPSVGMPATTTGAASAFYNIPFDNSSFGGYYLKSIVDNEIWKTIHSGTNSFNNSVFPIVTTEVNTGFYHGWVSFNFGGTINWNLNYNKYNAATGFPTNGVDFYETVIRELTQILGFNSLINYDGYSVFAANNYSQLNFPYYNFTRYDKMLKNSNNLSLISHDSSSSNCQMYDYLFNNSLTSYLLSPGCTVYPPVYNGNSGLFNCLTSVKYVGSTTVPVYTPTCFESGSSLSCFEDACFGTNSNNQYFLMSDRTSGTIAKRNLTAEERLVLCDIGYSVKGIFGNSGQHTDKNYGVSDCTGINIAGVNDGFNSLGGYSFQGNSGSDITISSILNNDYTGGILTDLRFEFVQDLTDLDAILSTTTGSLNTPFTLKSFVPGLHLLRYVPYDVTTGQRGNITYIYVNVLNNCIYCPSSLVRNGDFEEHNYEPNKAGQIYKACGWQNSSFRTSVDFYTNNSTFPNYSIPCNYIGHQEDKISGNHAYAGMYCFPSGFIENLKTELVSNLQPNTQYQLSFDVSLAEQFSSRSIKFQAFFTDVELNLTNNGTIPNANLTPNTILLTNNNFSNATAAAANGWETITLNFTTGNNTNLKYLYIGGLNNTQIQTEISLTSPSPSLCANLQNQFSGGSYYYVDNVKLAPSVPIIFLDAINDDFSSMPINTTSGGVTTSVYSNDIYNNLPASMTTISNVTFSLVSPLSISGATINHNGLIFIPLNTIPGTYTLTYKIELKGSCYYYDTATVIINVINPVETPNISTSVRANNLVEIIRLQNTGKIILSGNFTTYNNISRNRICRLNTDLTLDQTFTSVGGNPLTQRAKDIAIQNDNKIIVVGQFSGFSGGSNGFGVARLLQDGAIDTNFNVGGLGTGKLNKTTENIPYCCAVQPDGKILVGGDFYSYNGIKRIGIVRLLSNGAIDNTFVPIEFNDNAFRSVTTKILLQPDGKIVLEGFFNISNSVVTYNLVRLNSDGSYDWNFYSGHTVGTSFYMDNSLSLIGPLAQMALQPDGKIVVVGAFTKYNDVDVKNIVRLMPDGQIDMDFFVTTGVERAINDVIIEPVSNKIIIAGEFSTFGSTNVKRMLRLTTNGVLDTSFNIGTGTNTTLSPTCYYCANFIKCILKQPDSKIIVGGRFMSFNNLTASNITRIYGDSGYQAKGVTSFEFFSEPEINTNLVDSVAIYPNPSNGVFNIDLRNEEIEYNNLTIYNILGEKILTLTLIPKDITLLDLSQYSNGCYFARLENENFNKSLKIIKN